MGLYPSADWLYLPADLLYSSADRLYPPTHVDSVLATESSLPVNETSPQAD